MILNDLVLQFQWNVTYAQCMLVLTQFAEKYKIVYV